MISEWADMDMLAHCCAMAAFCRQRAQFENENASFWIEEAEEWDNLIAQSSIRQSTSVPARCRFEMTAAEAPSSHEFCVFDFPGCKRCPEAQHTVRTARSAEDPMESEALRAWAARVSRSKK
jgi:hypothetical protein